MKMIFLVLALLCTGTINASFKSVTDTGGTLRKKNTAKIQYGTASYYHKKFHGRKTASGQVYDQAKLTAAHNSLPLNTWVRVTNLRNKRSVIVIINDRLHYKNQRLVDLSHAAAKKLGYIGRGLTRVKLEVLGKKKPVTVEMGK